MNESSDEKELVAEELENAVQMGRNIYMEAALLTLRSSSDVPEAVAYAHVLATLAVALEERISRRMRAVGA